MCVSTLLEIETHRIDLQHDDENVGAPFRNWGTPLDFECLSASSLLWLLGADSVAELRLPGLTRKQFRTIILAADD